MLKAIEGVFRDGKIELLEPPPDQREARVLVTFLEPAGPIDLQARGISPAEAMEHRARLGAIIEDWDRPEMDVYDAEPMDKQSSGAVESNKKKVASRR